jgi:hypothetical protein
LVRALSSRSIVLAVATRTGASRAMHICRGQFKDYRQGKGFTNTYIPTTIPTTNANSTATMNPNICLRGPMITSKPHRLHLSFPPPVRHGEGNISRCNSYSDSDTQRALIQRGRMAPGYHQASLHSASR